MTDLLDAQRYDDLERQLSDLQAEFHSAPEREDAIFLAYRTFERGGADIRRKLQAWVDHAPDSAAAHAALGTYLTEAAWKHRGTAFAAKTSDEQLEEFGQFLEAAIAETRIAQQLDPTNPVPHLLELRSARGPAERAAA